MNAPLDQKTVWGTNGSDVIISRRKAQRVLGRGGDDFICGARSWQAIRGQGGDDHLEAEGPADVLRGGDGSDTLRGVSYTRMEGGPGPDALTGGAMEGGPGDDVLRDAEGMFLSAYIGGRGDDRLVSNWPGVYRTLNYRTRGAVHLDMVEGYATGASIGRDTIAGSWNPTYQLTITGSAFDDEILGSGEGEVICPLGGSDTVDAGGGSDEITDEVNCYSQDTRAFEPGQDSPSGQDAYAGGRGTDILVYRDEGQADVEIDMATGTTAGLEGDTLAGVEDLNIKGVLSATIAGDGENNNFWIEGGYGTETNLGEAVVDGGAGNDHIVASGFGMVEGHGADGNDMVFSGHGDDFLYGGAGEDRLGASDGFDEIDGGAAFDTCLNGETISNCEATSDPQE